MLTVRNRKNVEIVFVAGTLLLILLAEPALAKRVRKRVPKSNQEVTKNQKSSNNGQVSDKVSTSSQKARQEAKLSTSERNNSRRDIKSGVRQTKKVAVGKQPNKTKSGSSSTRKPGRNIIRPCIYPPLPRPRPFRRHRKRQSFETRQRRSFDTRERISMNHYYKEPPEPIRPCSKNKEAKD